MATKQQKLQELETYLSDENKLDNLTRKVMQICDTDKNQSVQLNEFLGFIEKFNYEVHGQNISEQRQQANMSLADKCFKLVDSDGNGDLDIMELKRVLKQFLEGAIGLLSNDQVEIRLSRSNKFKSGRSSYAQRLQSNNGVQKQTKTTFNYSTVTNVNPSRSRSNLPLSKLEMDRLSQKYKGPTKSVLSPMIQQRSSTKKYDKQISAILQKTRQTTKVKRTIMNFSSPVNTPQPRKTPTRKSPTRVTLRKQTYTSTIFTPKEDKYITTTDPEWDNLYLEKQCDIPDDEVDYSENMCGIYLSKQSTNEDNNRQRGIPEGVSIAGEDDTCQIF